MRIYQGPFSILKKVNKVSYRIELPPRLKIHHVFYTSYLKFQHENKDDMSYEVSKRTLIVVITLYNKEVKHIIID